MRHLQIFRAYDDGFVLLSLRQFLPEGLTEDGGFAEYCQLPKLETVVARLSEERYVLANAHEIRQFFRKMHQREFRLNLVYGKSSNNIGWCQINNSPSDEDGMEIRPGPGYTLGREYRQFSEFMRGRSISPPGYAGELCILAYREGSEIYARMRRKRSTTTLTETEVEET